MARMVMPLLIVLASAGAIFGPCLWPDALPQPEAIVAETPAGRTKSVLVAGQDLAAGSFITADALRWQPWPDVDLPGSYLVADDGNGPDLLGAVVRRAVAAGEPLVQGNIVRPGDGSFLAAVLDPGMRAVSVPVDEASSNTGLIMPGDHVDVILTQTVEPPGDPVGSRRVSATVLQDIRVIAMGRRLTGEKEARELAAGASKTATLEVSPGQAEKLAMVVELGRLAISLRSPAAPGGAPRAPGAGAASITWDSDVSPVLRPENQPRATLLVVRGDKAEEVGFRRAGAP